MPGRVEGATTEWAGRPSSADQLDAPARERPRLGRLDDHAQDRFGLAGLLGLQRGLTRFIDLESILGVVALQDDDLTNGVPAQAHRADPELILNGGGQWGDVLASLGNVVDHLGLTVGKIVKQVRYPFGEGGHLLLLQRHAGQP